MRVSRPAGRLPSRLAAAAAVAALVLGTAAGPAAANGSGSGGSTSASQGAHASPVVLTRVGTTSIGGGAPAAAAAPSTTTNEFGPSLEADQQIPHSGKVVHVAAAHVPTPGGNSVAATSSASGFVGISHRDQRLADSGYQWSLEPPDQGLCVGNGYVLEAVNDALAVYSTTGTLVSGPTALNPFFLLGHAIVRATPTTDAIFGPFISDPKCYYDSATQRWFVTALEIDVDSSTGAFGPGTHVELAVSAGSNPAGAWNLFSLDTTSDGTGCSTTNPCLPDQPLIGADAQGFYISTNSFPLYTAGFNGAQVYAFSKSVLESGSSGSITGQRFDTGTIPAPDGGVWYSLQPATAPPSGAFETAAGGTEYFLSALDFASTLDDRIAVWALTGTDSLATASPDLSLTHTVISSEVYGFPPDAQQKMGPTPLADAVHSPLELLAGNDDRMNQVVYADGNLWAGLNTVVQTPNGPTRVGAAYFVVAPSVSNSGDLSATMTNQGYVSVNQENVLFPSIGVNAAGNAIMTFTLVGPDYYPSVAYTPIDATNGAGDVYIAAAGAGPDDGFTGYRAFGGQGTGRWGDYSAAVADESGNLWFASEYIPKSCPTLADTTCRTPYANWGTWVGSIAP